MPAVDFFGHGPSLSKKAFKEVTVIVVRNSHFLFGKFCLKSCFRLRSIDEKAFSIFPTRLALPYQVISSSSSQPRRRGTPPWAMRLRLTLLSGEEALLEVAPESTVHELKVSAQREWLGNGWVMFW